MTKRRHDASMRTPWGKTMVKQLDLLGETATVSTDRNSLGALNLDALDAEIRPLTSSPDAAAVETETAATTAAAKQAFVAAIDSLFGTLHVTANTL